MAGIRIPLFPLELVLYPGVPLPLHIFEPRYKEMIGRCLAESLEFGVVLAQPEGVAATGCTAEILKVLKTYPDGRMDLLTVGQSAFHITQVFEDESYLEGLVEFLEDAAVEPSLRQAEQELIALFNRCHHLLFGRTAPPPDLRRGVALSHFIASEIPFELDFKQALLESRAEHERQAKLFERMNILAVELQQMERVRKRAGGNGHTLH